MVINGTTTTYTYDSSVANEYTQVVAGGVTHTPLYDDAGNITRDAQGYYHYYDYENRLVQVKDTNNTNTVAEYSYDAFGRRIESVASGVTKRYYYDGWRVLSETDGDGDLVYSYVYGNSLDEVLMRETWAGLADYYYVHDHLFSPVAIISDGLDAVVERYEYDAYGKCNIWDAAFTNSRSVSNFGNTIGLTGQRFDRLDNNNLDLANYKNRIYVIALGRFAQRDPLGIRDEYCIIEFEVAGSPHFPREHKPRDQYTDGMNIYVYVGSNPIVNYDIYGLSDVFIDEGPIGAERRRLGPPSYPVYEDWLDCMASCITDLDPFNIIFKGGTTGATVVTNLTRPKKLQIIGQTKNTLRLTSCCSLRTARLISRTTIVVLVAEGMYYTSAELACLCICSEYMWD